jgi:hypothetical protein
MVERLKRSLEHVEAPICPTCSLEMLLFRSSLAATEPLTILHSFHCSSCHRISETKSVVNVEEPMRRSKLSAPRMGRAA